ncbi:hypothetical protein MTO96_007626 [Rhipicephalus appendiculatus]
MGEKLRQAAPESAIETHRKRRRHVEAVPCASAAPPPSGESACPPPLLELLRRERKQLQGNGARGCHGLPKRTVWARQCKASHRASDPRPGIITCLAQLQKWIGDGKHCPHLHDQGQDIPSLKEECHH